MSIEITTAVVAAVIALLSMGAATWQAASARRQTNLQQRMLEEAAQPYVWVDIRPDDRDAAFFHLVLRNEGPTVAEDVYISIDPPLPSVWRPSRPVGPSGTDFSSIPPGRTMVWNLGVASEIIGTKTAKKFNITVSAKGPYGDVPPHTYRIDLAQYDGHAMRAQGTLSGVTRAISELTKQVKKSGADPS